MAIVRSSASAVPKTAYHLERLSTGGYDLIINTDAEVYGGTNGVIVNGSDIDLPPLTTLWFAPRKRTRKKKSNRG